MAKPIPAGLDSTCGCWHGLPPAQVTAGLALMRNAAHTCISFRMAVHAVPARNDMDAGHPAPHQSQPCTIQWNPSGNSNNQPERTPPKHRAKLSSVHTQPHSPGSSIREALFLRDRCIKALALSVGDFTLCRRPLGLLAACSYCPATAKVVSRMLPLLISCYALRAACWTHGSSSSYPPRPL